MARSRKPTIIICGGHRTPGPRTGNCDSSVHDYPLPQGYNDSLDVAYHRLNHQWMSVKCKTCGIYGWMPSDHRCTDCAVSP